RNRWRFSSGFCGDFWRCANGNEAPAKRCNYQRRRDSAGVSIMNWDRVEGNWKQLKGAVKEKWGKLTEDDLAASAGHRDVLADRIEDRYGFRREKAEQSLDRFIESLI